MDTNHCHTGEHAHNGGGCHPIGNDVCPLGEHEHLTERGNGCHPTGRDHYKPKEPSYFANIGRSLIAGLLCTGAGLAAGAGTSFTGPGAVAVGTGVTLTCGALIVAFETSNAKEKYRMLQEAKKRHDAMVEAKQAKDRPSSGTTPSKPGTTPTTTPTSTPTSTPTTTAPPPLTNADLAKANRDRLAGRISRVEMEAIKARYRCENLGIQSYCGQ